MEKLPPGYVVVKGGCLGDEGASNRLGLVHREPSIWSESGLLAVVLQEREAGLGGLLEKATPTPTPVVSLWEGPRDCLPTLGRKAPALLLHIVSFFFFLCRLAFWLLKVLEKMDMKG